MQEEEIQKTPESAAIEIQNENDKFTLSQKRETGGSIDEPKILSPHIDAFVNGEDKISSYTSDKENKENKDEEVVLQDDSLDQHSQLKVTSIFNNNDKSQFDPNFEEDTQAHSQQKTIKNVRRSV